MIEFDLIGVEHKQKRKQQEQETIFSFKRQNFAQKLTFLKVKKKKNSPN